jgi:hypothetical protein
MLVFLKASVADPDPGSFCPPDPGSGIGFFRIPDPTITSESLKHFFILSSFFTFLQESFFVSANLKNGLFRGEIFFSRKKNHPSEGQFFKNYKMCNSYESRSVSARVESYKKVRKQIK